jgi:hypothetical protein
MRRRGDLYVNPYNLGRRKNWQAVFGVGRYGFWSLYWMLPYEPDVGDGHSFVTVESAPGFAPLV